ncbi:hypothetical protein BD626DRAFT_213457 [Schizophyllum amplum]|uniref:Uncharacterized protein n=1 Tax=Schizophyllum amplum TaxID=97359 RepID=A0A550BY30_9AGAR|nr:hypothetical protein BD626DRAFT_213457 [Auriculariopsis ampla]
MPKLMNRHGPASADLYPRYVFGWLISNEELLALCEKHATHDSSMMWHEVVWGRWRAAGFEDDQLNYDHYRTTQGYKMLLYIAENKTPVQLDFVRDKERMARAKKVFEKEEDGRWFHMDFF